MVDRTRNDAAIVERMGELARSYGIEVKQVSYKPMRVLRDRKMELTVFLDMGDHKRLHEIKIRVEDIDKYHSGSDVRMRLDREIELALGAIDS